MSNAYFKVPKAVNEPIYQYEPGSPAREKLQAQLKEFRSQTIDVPLYIGGEKIYTEDKRPMSPPHDHKHILGHYSYGTREHVVKAIDSCLEARKKWSKMAWQAARRAP